MTSPTHFKCECQHCHGHLECPLEAAGLTNDCPHCGKPTELIAVGPERKSSTKSLNIILISVALLIPLITIPVFVVQNSQRKKRIRLEAAEAARITAQQSAEAEARANDPLLQSGWSITAIQMEKTTGSTVIHAVGTLQNKTDRRRFGVKVHLDLFDSAAQKIGAATDYQASIEPHARWQFSALVVNGQAVTAKVAAVEESP